MFKKLLSVIIAIAIISSLLIVPVNADIILPEGDYFTLTTEHVPSFKAGDTVEITFTVDNVPEDIYLLTVDLDFWFDETILSPVNEAFSSTCEELNASTEEDDAWEMLFRTGPDGFLYIGLMEDSDNWLGSNQSGVLSVTLVFTALKDSTAGDLLLYSTCCEGMTIDFEEGTGDGTMVYVEGPVPTVAPTEVPTAVPFDAENPVIDINFGEGFSDKKGVLNYTQTSDMFNHEYRGNLTLTNEFAIEIQGVFGYGPAIYGTGYQLETYGFGMIESWWTETVDPYVCAMDMDMNASHHIVLVGDVDSYTMYLDGEAVSSATYVDLPELWEFAGGDSFMSLGLGMRVIDRFRVYSGAPSAEEVLALYETVAPEPTPIPTAVPTEPPVVDTEFNADNPVIDINFIEGKNDKKGVLRYKQTSHLGYEYNGNIVLSDKFAVEMLGTFGAGVPIYHTSYQMEAYSDGMIESWWTETVNPHIIANDIDMTKEHHIVLVGNTDSYKMYIDGQLVVAQTDVMLSENWYYAGSDSFMAIGGGMSELKSFRVFAAAPNEEQVGDLYKNRAKIIKCSLRIDSKPSKLIYEIGEEFDASGLIVRPVVLNGENIDVSSDLIINSSDFNPYVPGKYAITVSYQLENRIYTNTFTVKVNEPAYVRSITLASKPEKLIYAFGEELDLNGLAIKAYYSDGDIQTITEGISVLGYDANTIGVQRLTVVYQGRTTSFSIKIV